MPIISVTTGRIRIGSASFSSHNPVDWNAPMWAMQEGIYYGVAMCNSLDEDELFTAISDYLLAH